jgi:PilZ domain
MLDDRRRYSRRMLLRRAKIVLKDGRSALDCVILDFSEGGARVKIDDWLLVPARFELRTEIGTTHIAEVRYRALATAGLEFVDAA